MGRILLLSLLSALNPTLLAASSIMLVLPKPARLMLGYLAGALMTSITLGLVIVFSLDKSRTVETTRTALSPIADFALAVIALIAAGALAGGRAGAAGERRSARDRSTKTPPRWQQALSRGSPRVTFVIGALLTLPGASYLAGLNNIRNMHYTTATTVLVVIGFNLVMLVMLEAPLISFALAPEWTPGAIERAKAWVAQRWRQVAVRGARLLGAALLLKGGARHHPLSAATKGIFSGPPIPARPDPRRTFR